MASPMAVVASDAPKHFKIHGFIRFLFFFGVPPAPCMPCGMPSVPGLKLRESTSGLKLHESRFEFFDVAEFLRVLEMSFRNCPMTDVIA